MHHTFEPILVLMLSNCCPFLNCFWMTAYFTDIIHPNYSKHLIKTWSSCKLLEEIHKNRIIETETCKMFFEYYRQHHMATEKLEYSLSLHLRLLIQNNFVTEEVPISFSASNKITTKNNRVLTAKLLRGNVWPRTMTTRLQNKFNRHIFGLPACHQRPKLQTDHKIHPITPPTSQIFSMPFH